VTPPATSATPVASVATVTPTDAGAPDAAAAPATSAVAELSARYLTGLFRAKPHLASFAGDHRWDSALPDLSPEAFERRDAELGKLLGEVQSVHPASYDDEVDVAVLKDAILLEQLYIHEIRDWEWDPRMNDSFPVYDPREIVAGRMSDLMHGDFAPEAERRRSLTAQLRALPAFITQAEAALTKPRGKRKTPKVYAEQAKKENTGRIEFMQTEVRDFTKDDKDAEAARVAAVTALKGYQTFLEKDLTPKATGEWRLGRDLYTKKFGLALQTELGPDAALAAAQKSFADARTELVALAKKLHERMWPGEMKAKTDAQIVNRVKEELSKHHPAPEALVAAHAKNLDQMRAFIESHDLLALPPVDTLTVQPMPIFKRGSSGAEYLAPGVLEHRPSFKATYYVDPIDPTWKKDKVESYLRGQNDYEVQLIAMHEAYPGHHTQFFYSRRSLNPLRAVMWNAAMVEGWAVYAEGQMVTLGWGGEENDRYRFYDLRGQMISCANTVLDVKLQSGLMTDEDAVRFMVEEGFQERAMAEKKLLRAKLDSTQLAQYFLGLAEIRLFETEYRAKVGPKWSQRAFNEAVIADGSVAVKFLRKKALRP
jgi:uncharacterized protein (DUF885 family)